MSKNLIYNYNSGTYIFIIRILNFRYYFSFNAVIQLTNNLISLLISIRNLHNLLIVIFFKSLEAEQVLF